MNRPLALSAHASPATRRVLAAGLSGLLLGLSGLLAPAVRAADPQAQPARSLDDWLARMHTASRQNNFVGTFVVTSPAGGLASGRIWHASEGRHLAEKIESLTGAPHATLRRGDDVLTLMPEQRVARLERRTSPGRFPEMPAVREGAASGFYAVREAGTDRVAGLEADRVLIEPRDRYRYGYRVWSERRSGLVVKLQTVDAQGQVLEEAAFSQLQIGAPLRPGQVVRSLSPPGGWRVERIASTPTTADAQGWELRSPVPGFKPVGCYQRAGGSGTGDTLQCVFSDGLATVSLFVESYDRQRHGTAQAPLAAGASQAQGRRLADDWWITVVGEVPPATLRAFANALERRP
jgi:sigma-E factor negative regulatory protein RseB